MASPAHVFVIGPPGSGKGTLCQLVAPLVGRAHVSVGDACRAAVAAQTPLGQQLAPFVERNELAPDALCVAVVAQLPGPSLVDGFPRTLAQARAVAQHADRLVLLTAPDEVCVQRILHRQVDPATGTVYNAQARPALSPEVAARLVRRPFDTDEQAVRARLARYHASIGDILTLFRGKIQTLDTSALAPEQLAPVLHALLRQPMAPPPYWKPAVEQCVVCMDKPADVLVVPCGHLCGCQPCLDLLLSQRGACPICREPMVSVCKVFHAGVVDDDAPAPVDEGDGGWAAHDARAQAAGAAREFEARLVSGFKLAVARCDVDGKGDSTFAVTVHPPNAGERVPVDVCCVIDISGSMADDCKYQSPEDETQLISMGLTVLDLVKHAVKTVIHTLGDDDRLSLVAFDSVAFTAFPLLPMDAAHKTRAVEALEKLMPRDSTNIYAGLEAGLDSLRLAKPAPKTRVPRKSALFLLTDGQPQESPPEGEVREMLRYFDKHGRVACVSTFGFGYNLKSDLLCDLARSGQGAFSFLPDAKVVGTCFVNAIANAATQMAQAAKLYIVAKEGTTLLGVNGHAEVETAANYVAIKLGNVQYGQQRDVVFRASVSDRDAFLAVVLEVEGARADSEPLKVRHEALLSQAQSTPDSRFAYHRALAVDALHFALAECAAGRGGAAVAAMKQAAGRLAVYAAQSEGDARATGLAGDVQGRCSKAISTVERWNRWGQHYLRAILRAHEVELCTNFLDYGLQHYGGTLFKQLVDAGGKIFVSLPLKKTADYAVAAPLASAAGAAGGGAAAAAPAADAQVFYGGGGGGCFAATCTVERDDGALVRVADVRKGDRLRVASGAFVPVVCVVALAGSFPLVRFATSGLRITPAHPVRVGTVWHRPAHLVDGRHVVREPRAVDVVYNVLLAEEHQLLVNGVVAVTWGHALADPAVAHAFYGTQRIVAALERLPGFASGLVHTSATHVRATAMCEVD